MGEKRIGQRVRVADRQVEWFPPSRSRRPIRKSASVPVIDLSVTGACLSAAADRMITVGTSVPVRLGEHRASVQVRRVTPTSDPKVNHYGVEFEAPQLDVLELISEWMRESASLVPDTAPARRS